MAADQVTGSENVQLHAFTDVDGAPSIAPYVAALEDFDALPQLQELKALAREHAGLEAGSEVLDVGCGFGLESFRLAQLVQPGGRVAGIDKSADFIKEAEARAAQAKLAVNFEVGDAESLPFADAAFDVTRAERLLVYMPDPKRALEEMRRVTRPGGVTRAVIVLTCQSDPRVCARSSKRWVLSTGFTLLWYFGHAGANAFGTKRNRSPNPRSPSARRERGSPYRCQESAPRW